MKEKTKKGKNVTAPRYGGREGFFWITEKVQLDAETPEKVHSGHDQTELDQVGDVREGNEKNQEQQPGGPQKS